MFTQRTKGNFTILEHFTAVHYFLWVCIFICLYGNILRNFIKNNCVCFDEHVIKINLFQTFLGLSALQRGMGHQPPRDKTFVLEQNLYWILSICYFYELWGKFGSYV